MSHLMAALQELWTYLQGKKTYIVCMITIVYAVSGWYTKFLPAQEAMNDILIALGGIGFRSALNK